MNPSTIAKPALFVLVAMLSMTGATAAASRSAPADAIRNVVDATIPALMAKDRIPAMAVGVTVGGKSYVFDYGVASKNPRRLVSGHTLFEIGSVSKTFTATLASWAQVQHRLSFSDTTETYLPELAGTPFGKVTLLSLGTHTPGGIPLQVPAAVTSYAQLIRYLEQWQPAYKMGTYRTYSNVGIGMLGLIAAKSMSRSFPPLMQQRLFPALGLNRTFIAIPSSEAADYAWGYTSAGKPVRMSPGVLGDEAYGIRTTAADLIRFVRENIDPSGLPPKIRQAIVQTHTGYFRAGPMTQDLIWEQYPYPVALSSLQSGNSYKTIFEPARVRAISPPQAPQSSVWINKTGSTNGFAAYVAYVPSQRLGIVLLANSNYPIPDRVTAAYRVLKTLAMRWNAF